MNMFFGLQLIEFKALITHFHTKSMQSSLKNVFSLGKSENQERSQKGREYEEKVRETLTFMSHHLKIPKKMPKGLSDDRQFHVFKLQFMKEKEEEVEEEQIWENVVSEDKLVCTEELVCIPNVIITSKAGETYKYSNHQLMKGKGTSKKSEWSNLIKEGKYVFVDKQLTIKVSQYDGEFDALYLLKENLRINDFNCILLYPNEPIIELEKNSLLFVEIKLGSSPKGILDRMIKKIPFILALKPTQKVYYVGILSNDTIKRDVSCNKFKSFEKDKLSLITGVKILLMMRGNDEIEKEYRLEKATNQKVLENESKECHETENEVMKEIKTQLITIEEKLVAKEEKDLKLDKKVSKLDKNVMEILSLLRSPTYRGIKRLRSPAPSESQSPSENQSPSESQSQSESQSPNR